jgi:N-acetylmuramic acid 6-phosphate (MurNAc-6-P) etherase
VDLILGSAGLTRTTFGFQVNKGGNHQEITLNYGDTIYGMTASGSTPITVNVLANVSNA